jgi:N-acetylglucosaminyldiphosphoundecaprenol N-acetyl-beta-D-mannosaminyltransferase
VLNRELVVSLPDLVRTRVPREPRERRRVCLDGAWIDQIDPPGVIELLRSFFASRTTHQIVTVNLDFLHIARHSALFKDTINQADLAVPDGMPLVWLSRLTGQPLAGRIAGVELVHWSCQIAAQEHLRVYLLGAAPAVAARAAQTLEARYTGLKVVGVHSPPFGPLTPEQDSEIVRDIRAAAPHLLLVALGAPRQDLWIAAHRESLSVPVAIGVGCVLDLIAGAVKRAPVWMQHSGLEWAFRMAQEPSRLWRRYLMADLPLFAELVLASMKGQPHVELTPALEK